MFPPSYPHLLPSSFLPAGPLAPLGVIIQDRYHEYFLAGWQGLGRTLVWECISDSLGTVILTAQLVGVPPETHPQPFAYSFCCMIYMGWHECATCAQQKKSDVLLLSPFPVRKTIELSRPGAPRQLLFPGQVLQHGLSLSKSQHEKYL